MRFLGCDLVVFRKEAGKEDIQRRKQVLGTMCASKEGGNFDIRAICSDKVIAVKETVVVVVVVVVVVKMKTNVEK